ncbi:gliding motility-associated lipoprotein GldJ [Arcticibacter tournemirensis]|uniref:Gliding motility lipoprotein GldJ n=1 Tax=Arcticibacter tournemirensis TaxID=699437 RepID=A0A4Q0MDX9_9SPHI|nr:SUMF1/EgtB/PvdO family nonheme iron enzyme [Arcticibacter tournemirensis]KAA8481653.1 SUMF1/EgtB/PvdO family nonheme iron enzyme [Arcticibacter tournemirensis]RXF71631.1 gliding motility lipoprotein GldJ [Arcticibacter tournemirensis]TQM48949.1 gliding motility-associated lipoprotein GldJ [Arcticibacter tournemirensis]
MKKLSILFSAGILALGIFGTSCKSKSSGASSKTGWAYNNKYNGGFSVARKVKPGPGPGLIAIEGGTFVMGGSLNQDLSYEYDNLRRRVTVASFYMDETEVSNVDWREYLYWIQRNFPEDREYYYNSLPDTLVWRRPLSYNEPYVENYLRHPAFQDYPVVGISWEQARDYAEWRTDRVNEEILRSKGIMLDHKTLARGGSATTAGAAQATTAAAPSTPFNTDIYLNGQYQGAGIDGKRMPKNLNATSSPAAGATTGKTVARRPVTREDGVLKEHYRLPTEAEWEYAALALAGNTQYENIEDGKIYPWGGLGVRSPKKKTQGLIMANFKRGEGDNMGTGGYLNDKADITAPVKSYMPNDFGLYNMAGNVNEWVEDTYRKLSFEDFEDFNPFRGNQYVNKRLEDKKKWTYAKDKYGRPIKDPAPSRRKQTWAELNGLADSSANSVASSGRSFDPDMRGFQDTVDQNLYGNTSLVNDRSKVYKGGSWNDRAYWLNPATRRFIQQDESSAEIGFRCAMNMVGSAEINTKYKPQFSQPKSRATSRAR